jgi:hypothetical protein
MLEPDRGQIEIFVDALLRHAGDDGYISVRAFHEGDSSKPFRVTPTALKGGLRFLLDVAEDDARRAAQSPNPSCSVRRSAPSAAESRRVRGIFLRA